MFSQVKTILLYSMQSCLKAFSINLLVVYRESVNLIAEMYPGFQIRGSSGPLLEKFGGPLLSFGGPANL